MALHLLLTVAAATGFWLLVISRHRGLGPEDEIINAVVLLGTMTL